MILKKVFRKYFFVVALTLLVFIFLAFFMNSVILRLNDRQPPIHSPVFFARLLDALGTDRIHALEKIESMNQDSLPFRFSLLDKNGDVLAGDAQMFSLDWPSQALPTDAYGFKALEHPEAPPFFTLPGLGPLSGFHGHQDHPLHEVGRYSAPRPGAPNPGPPPPPRDTLIRLPGEPAQYLLVSFRIFDHEHRKPAVQLFFVSLGLLILSILLGVGAALSFLFRSLQKKVILADSVIAELQSGNLKARFPIKKRDEFGEAMHRFNQMADEIELLVERLTNTEKSRMILLQELAHDLRTPVASLKNLLETLQTRQETLTPKLKSELISLSVKEIDYFERLIEDLLILAQVSEPKYHADDRPTDLVSLLDEESERVALNYLSLNPKLTLQKEILPYPVLIQGDPLLLRRMFRNALENAFSFARQNVRVTLLTENAGVKVSIEDDGQGFSEDALKAYGVRRMTRVLGSNHDGRLSVGLGSVILKTAAELHRGSVQVLNRQNTEGEVTGASVILRIPSISEW